MKKAFVTGGTGFVGSHVVRRLLAQGTAVKALVRDPERASNLAGLDVERVRGDLRDRASLEAGLAGCDALFHVAADYRLWARNPHELFDSNVQGTKNILEAARKRGVQRVVYTSTVSAVGRPGWDGVGDETLDPTPEQLIGPYKTTKFLAELEARKFASQGLPLVIVNPSTPIGSHDVKPTPTGRIVVDFLNRRMPAYLDTGLNLVDVEDVAAGHLLAAEKGKPGQRYILGNKNLSLKEILDLLSDITGLPSPKFRVPYAAAYAAGWVSTTLCRVSGGSEPRVPLDAVRMARHSMFFDASKAVRELGLPQTPVKDALSKAVDWFRANGYAR